VASSDDGDNNKGCVTERERGIANESSRSREIAVPSVGDEKPGRAIAAYPRSSVIATTAAAAKSAAPAALRSAPDAHVAGMRMSSALFTM